jgi:tetratricopeptide (TPR) repeat protein
MKLFARDILVRALLLGMLITLMGISSRPHHIDQTFTRVSQSLGSGNYLQAATNIAKIAEYFPWWTDLWLHAGRYAIQAGESEATIAYFSRYGSAQDLMSEDLILLGDAYRQVGNLESAEQVWRLALNSQSASQEIYSRLADIHRIQENLPALINDLKSLYQIRPNDANITFELGLLLSTLEPESALVYLEEAAQQDPRLKDSALDLQRKITTAQLAEEPAYTLLEAGRSLAAMEEWDLAAKAFQQATIIREDYAEAWAFLGEAKQHLTLSSSSSQNEAIGLLELETALQLNPESVTANVLMGIYWQRHNQYGQALDYIDSASKLNSENPMLHAELGRVLARIGDLEGAKGSYEHAIELAPQDPTYWRLLAEFSIHYQLEIRQIGLPAARQAVILSPDDPQSLDVIAQTLIILGDDLNAERYLWRALELDREFAPAHMHLGIIYMNQGDVDRARLQFSLAKDIAPDDWTMDQAQRLIGYYFP